MTLSDAVSRTKVWLDSYLLSANLTDDNGDAVTYITTYGKPNYPAYRVFFAPKNIDLVFTINDPTAKPLYNYKHYIYAYIETVPIHITCIDKDGITGAKLKWTAEVELRRILEAYPIGSLRLMETRRETTQQIGGTVLYDLEVQISYKRSVETAATDPTFSQGVIYTYEGDRLSGGTEGTWSLTAGAGSTCAQTITSDNNLYLNQTVFSADSYTINGTNLGISTSVYGNMRIRYRTSGAATLKIQLGFSSGTQIILAESASSSYTVVNAAITAAKTLNTIQFWICDGVGTVTVDFVQIYADTYILPNVVSLPPPSKLKDVIVDMFGSGDAAQAFGSELLEVTMACDLDMEPWTGASDNTALSWKRPQTNGTKTDYNKTDVFYELLHTLGISVDWVWLSLGEPSFHFKARLVEVNPVLEGNMQRLNLVWREYRHGDASGESAIERYGWNL